MLYMIQMCTNLPNAPHTPPISVHRPPRHHQRAPKERPPQDPRNTDISDTKGLPASHPGHHPTLPRAAKLAEDNAYIDVDAPDLDSPPRQTPPDPGHPPLTPTTIRDPNFQGRALDIFLGWYRLQESSTKLTVKALRDLATPGRGLHEAIVDLIPRGARQHTQDQRIWILPIEWGLALTHKTDTYVTHK